MTDLVTIDLPKPSLTEVIAQAARDPNTDVAKMEKLLSMYERIEATNAERSFNAAMNKAQEEMRPVSQDASNPQTRSKYASFAALDSRMRPIYTKHGFSMSFDTGDGAADGNIRVICKVSHCDGHSERPHLDMPADGKGAKGGDVMTRTHATMAAVTYAKRGLLKMVFNIAEGDDDDGNAATARSNSADEAPLNAVQLATIQDLIHSTKADIEAFCNFVGVSAVPQIKQRDFKRAVAALQAKAARVKASDT